MLSESMHADASQRAQGPRAFVPMLGGLALVLGCSVAQAQRPGSLPSSGGPAAGEPCAVPAYIMPPAEPPVRAAPNRRAPILGRLKATHYDTDDVEGADVTILELKEGWARIAAVTAWNDVSHDSPAGWIETRPLAFTLQTELGFVAPDPASAVAYESEDWIVSSDVRRYLGCQGEWLHLSIRSKDGKRHTGWFRGACTNQRTTCDGTYGDHRERTPTPNR